jgi:hypothetical protein
MIGRGGGSLQSSPEYNCREGIQLAERNVIELNRSRVDRWNMGYCIALSPSAASSTTSRDLTGPGQKQVEFGGSKGCKDPYSICHDLEV